MQYMQKALTSCISCPENCLVRIALISGGIRAHLQLLPDVGRHFLRFPQGLKSGGALGLCLGKGRGELWTQNVAAAEEEDRLGQGSHSSLSGGSHICFWLLAGGTLAL